MDGPIWVASVMSLFPNRALPIVIYFDPKVVSNNKIFSILVRFLSIKSFVANMDIFLAVFIPNVVVSDGIGILWRQSFKLRMNEVWILSISFCLLVISSILLLAFGSIVLLAFGSIVYLAIILLFASFSLKRYDDLPLSHIFFLWGYIITISSNVCNVFKMWSTLFRIRCMYFGFVVKTINISLQVLVYCT